DDTYWSGDATTGWGAATPLTAAGTTSWSVASAALPGASNLSDGSYQVTATAYDKVGNSSSAVSNIAVDNLAPSITVTDPTTDAAGNATASQYIYFTIVVAAAPATANPTTSAPAARHSTPTGSEARVASPVMLSTIAVDAARRSVTLVFTGALSAKSAQDA